MAAGDIQPKARDTQRMGNKTPLATTPYQVSYGAGNAGIVRNTGADWFGPLNPMFPVAPPDVRGRILDYQSGFNLNLTPKTEKNGSPGISFEMLRNFSDAYDLLRLVIETRKDQMARLVWNITVREHAKDKKDQYQDRIQEIERFFVRPDKEHFWQDWLRLVLEDLLVLDAPAIHIRRTYGGDLYSLEPLDGGTIKRVIDDWGRTPMSPVPAYQQVLKGYPAVDYTTDQLLYKPRNIRTHRIYGFSPVEQIIMTINIGLRRQSWQLQSFTEGNIPEALIGTPNTWTPDQIASFQNWFDGMLEGNSAEKRRAKFVPGEIAKGYVATKTDELFGAAEEWLARVICFAFSISPQPFLKMMNRATAETAQETAASEGLAPMQGWVKGLMDSMIIDLWGEEDLEFEWLDEDELDPDAKSMILDRDVGNGSITMNDSRLARGLEPYPDKDANRPMFKTATGYVPVYLTPEEKAENDAKANAIAGLDPDGNPLPPKPGEKPPEGGPEGEEPPPGGAAPPKPPVPGEVAEKSDRPFDLVKGGETPNSSLFVDADRPYAAKREKKIKTLFEALFAKAGKDIAKQIKAKLKEKGLAKADDPKVSKEEINEIINSLDLAVLTTAQDELAEFLEEVYGDSGRVALGLVGTDNNSDLVNQVSERAVEWSKNHAGDLVGANPDSPFAITHTTRDMLRGTITDGLTDNLSAADIADNIRDAYAFSEDRAKLIAFTEITSANSEGALAGYEEAKAIGVKAKKSWLVREDGCEICSANAAAGKIELEEAFPSGDMAPGAHPKCRCVLIPEVEDDEAEKLAKWYQGSAGAATVDATMSDVFPVDLSQRAPIWAMGGNNEEATAERNASILMHVNFDDVVATQDYVDWDKVALYRDDPTAKGFSPMAHQIDGKFYLQDGHHRSVASKLEGNKGMIMAVKDGFVVITPPDPIHIVQQPRAPTGKFSNDPAHGFMSGTVAPGIPGVKAKSQAKITEN